MQIDIPTQCPSCGSTLEVVNSQLFCRNKSCEAQSFKVLEGFCKKMKIKGFGVKTLEKIGIKDITELYKLTEEDLVQATSAKVGSKLFAEIEKSKGCSFEDFIKSLGINLIGATAAPKVVAAFPKPDALIVSYQDLRDAGLGEKAAQSFWDYLNSPRGLEEMDMAADIFTFQVKEQATTDDSIGSYPSLEICITGKLTDYKSRAAVTEVLSQYNITVKKSVTKNVSYLICEDSAKTGSSSYKKALDKNLPIITIKELLQTVQNKNLEK